jgi:hypothetical protein
VMFSNYIQFLAPSRNRQRAILAQNTHITRSKGSLSIKIENDLTCLLVSIVISDHDVRTDHTYLTLRSQRQHVGGILLTYIYLNTRCFLKSSLRELGRTILLRHDNRRRLRETVSLDDRNTDITKKLLHLELQFGTTREGTFEFTTEIVLDFVQYEIFSEVPMWCSN